VLELWLVLIIKIPATDVPSLVACPELNLEGRAKNGIMVLDIDLKYH
jgi:hypothetical protein